ncbi:mercuric ion transport protein [Chryseobacterium sp. MDT2-18]|nr:mercuric ion transport protein [Chryseobacterium sp. MDT2-18]
MKTDKKLISTGLLAAFTASLCCITPLLAFIAGTSGLAATFSWLEPLRPYLIALTVFVLGFAWYLKLKPKQQLDCSCEKDEKIPFTQSKMFLGMVTLFAVVMLAFSYYSAVFYPKTEKQNIVVNQSDIREIEFTISGMTCASCGEHVNSEVHKLTGIISSDASYENKNAVVKFDDSKQTVMKSKRP